MNADNEQPREWLTPKIIKQLREKLEEASKFPYAEVILVVKRGRLRFIRSQTSEPIDE